MFLKEKTLTAFYEDEVSHLASVKYRSSTEIMDLMLRSIRSGSSKAKIMDSAYLSYGQMKGFLQILEDKEMIGLEEQSGLYFLKPNGLTYINAYAEIRELLVVDPTLMKGPKQQQEKYNF